MSDKIFVKGGANILGPHWYERLAQERIHNNMQRTIGWEPKVGLEVGLKETMAHFERTL